MKSLNIAKDSKSLHHCNFLKICTHNLEIIMHIIYKNYESTLNLGLCLHHQCLPVISCENRLNKYALSLMLILALSKDKCPTFGPAQLLPVMKLLLIKSLSLGMRLSPFEALIMFFCQAITIVRSLQQSSNYLHNFESWIIDVSFLYQINAFLFCLNL